MSIHEFTTICLFYLQHPEAMSVKFREAFINKFKNNITEFNEF
jgi:hypothetical protein